MNLNTRHATGRGKRGLVRARLMRAAREERRKRVLSRKSKAKSAGPSVTRIFEEYWKAYKDT